MESLWNGQRFTETFMEHQSMRSARYVQIQPNARTSFSAGWIDGFCADIESSLAWSGQFQVTAAGRVCLLDVDVQGVERVQQNYASNGIFVWIAPPSIDALEERLRKRGTDSDNVIQARLKEAVNELSFAASSGAFDYTIINDNFDRAYAELKGIIESVVG